MSPEAAGETSPTMTGTHCPATEAPADASECRKETAWFFRIEIEHLWRAVPFLLLIWITSLGTLPALDFWWHLKSGQIILESGSIPTTDIFSYTAAGKTYLLQNWLGEVILYGVYAAGGPALVIFFNTVLLLATFAPVYLLCRRRAEGVQAAVLASCLAAVPLACQANIRPQVFSFLMFAWFYFILLENRERGRNLLWLLPVMMAVWVNLHGGFILGIFLVVLLWGLDFAAWLFGAAGGTRFRQMIMVPTLMLTAGATLLNPQFHKIYSYLAEVAHDPVSHRYVLEWQPPQVDNLGDVLRFFAPFLVGLFILLRSKTRADVNEILLFLAFALFGLTARRNAAWFALVTAPILAPHISAGLRFPLRKIKAGATRWLNLLLAVLLLILTSLGLPWFQRPRNERDRDLLHLEERLPVRAVDFIRDANLQGRIFHPQHYGDYIIWRLHPAHRTFLDGRVHLFPLEVAQDYFAVLRGAAGWEAVIKRYRIEYLLLDRNDEEGKRLLRAVKGNPAWRLLYEDDRSILFQKNGSS